MLLTALFTLLLAATVTAESALLLLLTIGVVALGVDRILRLHPGARFHGPTATVLYLFVPMLYALGMGLLLQQVSGLWLLLCIGGAAVLFAVVLNAEYLTVEPNADTYEAARLLLLVAIIVVALAVFAVVFTNNLPVWLGAVLVAGTSLLLTVDILRELEADTTDLLSQAGAVALVMGECRLVVYFLPLSGLLAGVFLFVVFYAATGLVQSRVNGKLDRQTWITYAGVAGAGFLFVLIARLITR